MAKNKQYIRQKGESTGFRNSEKQDQDMDDEETLLDIVEVKENAQDFFEKNQTLILGVITGFILLLGGYLGYKYAYQAPREQAGLEAMYKAESQFERDSFALALDSPGAGFSGFLDIIDEYSGTKAANLAKYYAGVSYLNLGNYEKAIEYLKGYSAYDDVTPISKNGALGDAYAESGDLEQAKSYYTKAAGFENTFLAPYYLNKLGMLNLSQDDKAAAKANFQEIVTDYPQSTEAAQAKKFAEMLN